MTESKKQETANRKQAWLPLVQLVEQVTSGVTTATALVEEALRRAEADEHKALLEIVRGRALERAKAIDAQIASGSYTGRLAGVPFIAKDNFLTFGSKTTAASNILKNFEAPYQSTAIERLEQEGAICIAKANLDAFAHGSSTENSDFQVTHNPHDKTRVPGGSSGGSAAAVALRIAPFALGTDTGGSIRLPASYCGIVGFKPTYGLVSRSGVVAMGSSTDVIGPMTTRAEDAALVLDVMAGRDPLDSTTIERSDEKYTGLSDAKQPLTIGVIKEHMAEGVDPQVRECITSTLDKLKASGATIKEISLPSADAALAAYYILVPAEISSNLARYDGVRFGHSAQEAETLEELYAQTRNEGFGDEAKRRIMIGNYVLSSGYYDAYYKKAQQVRTVLIEEYNKALSECDVLVGPVAPTTAFKIGETEDPLQMYLVDVMTVGVNLTGVPAASVPAGQVEGLPVGLHIIGRQRADKMVLSAAQLVEDLA